jgi:hypothetical protein
MQVDDQLQLLLTEFRAFRDTEWREFRVAVSSWQQETGERVAQLETQVKAGVTGNGQPSRLQVAERSIDQLNRFRYWLLGCAGVLSVILHYVLPGGRR